MYIYTYLADLIDETGCFFTASTEAASKDEARAYFQEAYPESRVRSVQTQREIDADASDRYWAAKNRDY